MTLEEFRALLDDHGPWPEHWPAHLRTPAQALLVGSTAAQDALAEARDFDALLRLGDPARAVDTAALAQAKAAVWRRLDQRPAPAPLVTPIRRSWLDTALALLRPRLAMPLVTAVVLGVLAGSYLASEPPTGIGEAVAMADITTGY